MKVGITVLPIIDVKTRWNLTLELLEQAYRLRELTYEQLQNPKSSNYSSLFTTQNEQTIVNYIMEVLKLFQYLTLRMLKRHTVTLHHVITVYNDIFDHIDGVTQALPKQKIQWKEDLFFAMKLARQKVSIYHAEMTLTMGMLLISAHILDSFRKL